MAYQARTKFGNLAILLLWLTAVAAAVYGIFYVSTKSNQGKHGQVIGLVVSIQGHPLKRPDGALGWERVSVDNRTIYEGDFVATSDHENVVVRMQDRSLLVGPNSMIQFVFAQNQGIDSMKLVVEQGEVKVEHRPTVERSSKAKLQAYVKSILSAVQLVPKVDLLIATPTEVLNISDQPKQVVVASYDKSKGDSRIETFALDAVNQEESANLVRQADPEPTAAVEPLALTQVDVQAMALPVPNPSVKSAANQPKKPIGLAAKLHDQAASPNIATPAATPVPPMALQEPIHSSPEPTPDMVLGHSWIPVILSPKSGSGIWVVDPLAKLSSDIMLPFVLRPKANLIDVMHWKPFVEPELDGDVVAQYKVFGLNNRKHHTLRLSLQRILSVIGKNANNGVVTFNVHFGAVRDESDASVISQKPIKIRIGSLTDAAKEPLTISFDSLAIAENASQHMTWAEAQTGRYKLDLFEARHLPALASLLSGSKKFTLTKLEVTQANEEMSLYFKKNSKTIAKVRGMRPKGDIISYLVDKMQADLVYYGREDDFVQLSEIPVNRLAKLENLIKSSVEPLKVRTKRRIMLLNKDHLERNPFLIRAVSQSTDWVLTGKSTILYMK